MDQIQKACSLVDDGDNAADHEIAVGETIYSNTGISDRKLIEIRIGRAAVAAKRFELYGSYS